VEKFLGEPVIGFIPSDYQTTVNSINLGTPLLQSEPNSKIAQEIRRIAARINDGVDAVSEEQSQPRKSLWNSFLKRGSTPSRLNLHPSLEKVS
jgi:MinD-like ATPase involved in chromosome partitioning or flagellar assembly